MQRIRDSYCSFCGTRFEEPLEYPRTCASCRTQIWANPLPVPVVLQPIEKAGRTGLLVIRRAVPPGIGTLAFPGGFLEEHESWQHGGAREVFEETGATIDPATLQPFWFASSSPRPNRVMLFSLGMPIAASALAPFALNLEVSERGIVFGPDGLDAIFAFALHVEAARRYFAERGVTGPHDFTSL